MSCVSCDRWIVWWTGQVWSQESTVTLTQHWSAHSALPDQSSQLRTSIVRIRARQSPSVAEQAPNRGRRSASSFSGLRLPLSFAPSNPCTMALLSSRRWVSASFHGAAVCGAHRRVVVGLPPFCPSADVPRCFHTTWLHTTWLKRASAPAVQANSQSAHRRADVSPPPPASASLAVPAEFNAPSTTPELIVSQFNLPTHIHTFPITISPLSASLPAKPTYGDLHVSRAFEHRLASFGLLQPTPIQCAAIPYLTHHTALVRPASSSSSSTAASPPDLLITDEPGTGKTLAYAVPLLSQVNPYLHALQAVVVVPSRALAVQLAKVMRELNAGGRKARQRNPVRVEICAQMSASPGVIANITQPRPPPTLPNVAARDGSRGSQPRASGTEDAEDMEEEEEEDEEVEVEEEEAGVPVGRVAVPGEFVAEHAEGDGLLLGSPVAQILIGTPHVLHELLVQRGVLDCRELKYLVVDEADTLIAGENKAALLTDILSLRNKPQQPSRSQSETASPSLPAVNTAFGSFTVPATTTEPLSLSPPARTQVTLVSSVVSPEMLHFAARHLSPNRHVLSPASVPHLTRGHHLTFISRLVNAPTKNNPRRTVLAQQLHLRPQIKHHYALYPLDTNQSEKAAMLLQLLLAIRGAMRHSSPVRGQPQWVRHDDSRLKSGVAGVPPLSDRLPQTTLVVFSRADHIFPTLSLLASHLDIAVLTRQSSRTEVRDALSLTPPPEVILATDRDLLGLDLKAVSHVVNYSAGKQLSTAAYYRRAGRCGRRGAVWKGGRVITMCREGLDEVEAVEGMAVVLGAAGVTQVVVRNGKIYERGAARLNRKRRQQQWLQETGEDDERELTEDFDSAQTSRRREDGSELTKERPIREPPPARYLDSLLGTTRRSTRAST